jgi:hypothetical protein
MQLLKILLLINIRLHYLVSSRGLNKNYRIVRFNSFYLYYSWIFSLESRLTFRIILLRWKIRWLMFLAATSTKFNQTNIKQTGELVTYTNQGHTSHDTNQNSTLGGVSGSQNPIQTKAGCKTKSRRFTPSTVDRPLLTFWAVHAGDNYCTRPFHCCCPVQSVCGWWWASSSGAAADSCPPWRRPSRTRHVAQRSLAALALSTSSRETAATVPHATEPGKFGLWATGGRKYGDSYKTACKSGWALKKVHLLIFLDTHQFVNNEIADWKWRFSCD